MPPMLVPSVPADSSRGPEYSATPVAPVVNAGPQQIGQLGEAMSRAGSQAMQTGQTMGDQIQNTVDDANVRSAETGFLQQAQTITDNYTHQLGKNAMDAYPAATAALAKAKQDAAGALTNPIQQRMFNYVSTNHLMMFGRQMGDHNFQQTVNYGVKEHNDSADAQGQLAATNYSDWQRPDGDYANYKTNAVNETLAALHLSGIAPDSAQAKSMVQQKTSAMDNSVLISMTGQEHWDEAKTFYAAAVANHELDQQMQDKWGVAITEGHNQARAKDAATQIIQSVLGGSPDQQRIAPVPGGAIVAKPASLGEPNASPHPGDTVGTQPSAQPGAPFAGGPHAPLFPNVTDVMGSPRAGGRVHDGIDYGVPVGTPIVAAADGTVSKVWNDTQFGGGLSMQITYPNGYVEGFAHLSTQNYQPGQKVSQGATLGLSGQTGNATGPTVHQTMRDPNGQLVDPRSVSPAPKDPLTFTDANMLQSALQQLQGRTDLTELQKADTENSLLRQYNLANDVKNQKYNQVKSSAVDYYYSHGGTLDGAPTAMTSQLKPEDLHNLSKPIPVETDPETMTSFILNPKTITADNVKAAFANGQLSKESYISLLTESQKIENKPEKVIAATLEADRLKHWADQAGIPSIYATQSPEQKRDYADLLVRTQQDIDQEQITKGRELTQTEKDGIMQRDVQQHVVTRLRSGWSPMSWIGGQKTYQGPSYRTYQAPVGTVGTVEGADGKVHYVDANKKDLGVVPQ